MPLARARQPKPPPEDVPGAEGFLPVRHTLPTLRAAIPMCRGCTLSKYATQAVFGAGSAASRAMLIGDVPGDRDGPNLARWTFATVHPASVRRAPDDELRRVAKEEFIHDFELVGEYFKKL